MRPQTRQVPAADLSDVVGLEVLASCQLIDARLPVPVVREVDPQRLRYPGRLVRVPRFAGPQELDQPGGEVGFV